MDELTRWLGQQLDEDERIARRAGDTFWQIGETGVIVATEGDRAEECASVNWAGVAEHIVRHDPVRVLREIDAKRQALAHYEQVFQQAADGADSYVKIVAALGRQVRIMASVYADRPGYRAEWRP
ncbi:DUF6221 family protein [Streptomyces sp. NPDC091281]|uniref:DUF6221 family protein n=1 Tax=Streptomyces sp. NPDC091281 TaxID=3365985 RepID=UPI00380370F7